MCKSSKDKRQPGQPAQGVTRAKAVSLVFVLALLVVCLHEWVRQLIFPEITLWGFHLISIAFTSFLAAMAASLVIGGRDRLIRIVEQESASRIQVEQKVERLSKEWVVLRGIMEMTPTGIIVLDRTGTISFANARAEGILRLKKEEMTAADHGPYFLKTARYSRSDLPDDDLLFRGAVASGQAVRGVRRTMEWPDGGRTDVVCNAAPILGEQGRVEHVVATFEDVTQSVATEEALRRTTAEQALLLENIDAQVWYITDPEKYGTLNRAHADFLGREKHELEGVSVHDLLPKEEADICVAGNSAAFRGKEKLCTEEWVHRPGGEMRLLSLTKTPKLDENGDVEYVVCTAMDTTDRKRLEEALRKSEEKYRSLYRLLRLMADNMPDLLWVKDMEDRFLFINQAMCDKLLMCGSPENAIGKTDMFFAEQERKAGHVHTFGEICVNSDIATKQEKGPGRFLEDGFVRDKKLILDVHKAPLWDETGEMIGTVGCGRDVTSEKETERALRREHAFHAAVIKHAAEGICVFHEIEEVPYVVFSEWNDRMREISGYTMEEMNRQGWSRIFDHDAESPAGATRRPFRIPRGEEALADEWEITRADGEKRTLSVSSSVFETEDAEGKTTQAAVFASDITARRKIEEDRIRTGKLEAMGILAGGIAHDFNNLLNVILGNIDMALMEADPEDRISTLLSEAEEAVVRASDLARKFIVFSTGGAPVKGLCSIRGLIEDSASLVLSGSNVTSEYSLPDDLWAVEIDRGQIGQAIGNVILNGREAMAGGGALAIHAENVIVGPEEEGPIASMRHGRYVKVVIKDHGIGIPGDDLERVFDPYFTTKKKGEQKGIGLGLSIAHSIVAKHGGSILIDSQPEVGTTVTIYLPASANLLTPHKAEPEEPHPGGKRILVMDDEEMMRSMVKAMLERMGFEAETACHGDEAVQLYLQARDAGKPFDAAILDLTVRYGAGGVETIRRLLEIDPGIKAIVSSGYSDSPVMTAYADHGFKGALQKPYAMKNLRGALNEILRSAADTQHVVT